MGKLKYGISAIITVGIIGGSVPYITKKSINNSIEKKQKELKMNGINLSVVSDKGYINSKREIEINIEDSIKFLDYMSQFLEIDIDILNVLTNNGSYLENLSIKGTTFNTNIFPENINVELAFDKLPNDLKQLMRKEPIVNKLIKSLALNLKLDKNGNVSFLALNDIIINDNGTNIKLLKPQIVFKKDNYLTKIQNITLKLNRKSEKLLIYFDDISDDLHYKNTFNLHETTKINKIKFNYTNQRNYENKLVSYRSEKNKIIVNSNSKNDEIDMSVNYKMENTMLRTNDLDTELGDLNLEIGFNGLKKQPIQELSDYKNTSNILEPRLQEIINYGFSMNLKSNINNIKNNKIKIFEAKNISFNLLAKLKRNNLNKNSKSNDISKNISLNGTVEMDKHIVDLMKPIQQYNTNIINGISHFDIKFIDSKLFINEHQVN